MLVFKKKSRRVEDLETLLCEFSSFRPSRSFVKIIEFVRTEGIVSCGYIVLPTQPVAKAMINSIL